jgi:hypothetical protein
VCPLSCRVCVLVSQKGEVRYRAVLDVRGFRDSVTDAKTLPWLEEP